MNDPPHPPPSGQRTHDGLDSSDRPSVAGLERVRGELAPGADVGGVKPKRVQLSRAKGWRLPPNTVVVSRPSRWGNPFDWQTAMEEFGCTEWVAKAAVASIYRDWLTMIEPERFDPELRPRRVAILASYADLRGRNLGCWCAVGQPCHGDVLLELVNGLLSDGPTAQGKAADAATGGRSPDRRDAS